MIKLTGYICQKCRGTVPIEGSKTKKTCTCDKPTMYGRGPGKERPKVNTQTFDQILHAIERWQMFWMNQTINEEDTKNYRARACGIDANMRHDLAEKIMELLK